MDERTRTKARSLLGDARLLYGASGGMLSTVAVIPDVASINRVTTMALFGLAFIALTHAAETLLKATPGRGGERAGEG